MNYNDIMNAHPLKEITISTSLKAGDLIGFKAFGDAITAAYPLFNKYDDRIVFKIGTMLDGTRIVPGTDNPFVNDPPINIKEANAMILINNRDNKIENILTD